MSTSSYKNLLSISPKLLSEIRQTLLECGQLPVELAKVRVLFVDSRINPWKYQIPQAHNELERVDGIIALLHNQFNNETKENALLSLLKIVKEKTDSRTYCHARIDNVINQLIKELTTKTKRIKPKPPPVFIPKTYVSSKMVRETNLQDNLPPVVEKPSNSNSISYDKYVANIILHLQNKDLEGADRATNIAFSNIAKHQKIKLLRKSHMSKFPCDALTLIDQCWQKYSNKHFGISVQSKIWSDILLLEDLSHTESIERLGIQLGWHTQSGWLHQYNQFTFSYEAPKGHLPSLRILVEEDDTSWYSIWQNHIEGILSCASQCFSLA